MQPIGEPTVGEPTAFAQRHQEIIDLARQLTQQRREAMAHARRLVRQSTQHSDDVAAAAAAARNRLTASAALLAQLSSPLTRMPSVPPADADAPREAGDADGESGGARRNFRTVRDLIEQVELAAMRDADALDGLIWQIKQLIGSDTDHYVLMGILVEGIVQAVDHAISTPEQNDVVSALLSVLLERIGALRDGAMRNLRSAWDRPRNGRS